MQKESDSLRDQLYRSEKRAADAVAAEELARASALAIQEAQNGAGGLSSVALLQRQYESLLQKLKSLLDDPKVSEQTITSKHP